MDCDESLMKLANDARVSVSRFLLSYLRASPEEREALGSVQDAELAFARAYVEEAAVLVRREDARKIAEHEEEIVRLRNQVVLLESRAAAEKGR